MKIISFSFFHSCIFQDDLYLESSKSSKWHQNGIKVIKMASESSKWHQSHQKSSKSSKPPFYQDIWGFYLTFIRLYIRGLKRQIWGSEKEPKILHNLVKSALIWMVLTFLEMGADSGSNRPIRVINSPLFNLALEEYRSGLSIP